MTPASLVQETETDFGDALATPRPWALPTVLDAYERALILVALAAADGHQRRAARMLGIGATTLNQKMKRLNLRGVALGGAEGTSEPTERNPAAHEEYRWRGRLPSGHRIEIRAVNGDIRVEPATGNEVEVVALKPDLPAALTGLRVEIMVVQSEEALTIAAQYSSVEEIPADPGPSAFPPAGELRVNFRVRVPRESALDARTLNGNIEVHGLLGAVHAESASGSVSMFSGTLL
jgi:hypothetical protein